MRLIDLLYDPASGVPHKHYKLKLCQVSILDQSGRGYIPGWAAGSVPDYITNFHYHYLSNIGKIHHYCRTDCAFATEDLAKDAMEALFLKNNRWLSQCERELIRLDITDGLIPKPKKKRKAKPNAKRRGAAE